MKDIDIVLLLDESKKQTEYLRRIRNWVAFAGIMFIVIPLLFWFMVIMGFFGALLSL